MEKKYILTEKDIANLFYNKYPELIGIPIECDSLAIKVYYDETDTTSIKDKIKLLTEINSNINRYKNQYSTLKKELSEIKIPKFIDCLDDYELFTKIKRKAELKDMVSDLRSKLFTESKRYYELIEQIEKMDLK